MFLETPSMEHSISQMWISLISGVQAEEEGRLFGLFFLRASC